MFLDVVSADGHPTTILEVDPDTGSGAMPAIVIVEPDVAVTSIQLVPGDELRHVLLISAYSMVDGQPIDPRVDIHEVIGR